MNLDFFFHGNIRTRYYYNYDTLHRDDKSATLFNDNIILALN